MQSALKKKCREIVESKLEDDFRPDHSSTNKIFTLK